MKRQYKLKQMTTKVSSRNKTTFIFNNSFAFQQIILTERKNFKSEYLTTSPRIKFVHFGFQTQETSIQIFTFAGFG